MCSVCNLFVVLLLCLVDPVKHYDHLVGEWVADRYAFSLIYGFVLCVRVCLLFPLFDDYDSFWIFSIYQYENTPIQIYRKFHLQIPENFQIKKC